MESTSLISQLTEARIVALATIVIVVLYVRYSASKTCRDICKAIDDQVGAAKAELAKSIKENRQEIAALRTSTRRDFKEVRTYSE